MRAITNLFRTMAGIDLQSVAPPPDPRSELKRLRQETIRARQHHELELEKVRRYLSLGPIADQCDRELKEAEAAAGASVDQWAEGETESVGNDDLFKQVEIARSRGLRARIAADGALKQLTARDWDHTGSPTGGYTSPAELEARHALRDCEDREQRARAPIIQAEVEPIRSELIELMERVRELDRQLQGFEAFARYGTNSGKYSDFLAGYSAARQFATPLRTAEEKTSARIPFSRFDNALKVNPDAQFEG